MVASIFCLGPEGPSGPANVSENTGQGIPERPCRLLLFPDLVPRPLPFPWKERDYRYISWPAWEKRLSDFPLEPSQGQLLPKALLLEEPPNFGPALKALLDSLEKGQPGLRELPFRAAESPESLSSALRQGRGAPGQDGPKPLSDALFLALWASGELASAESGRYLGLARDKNSLLLADLRGREDYLENMAQDLPDGLWPDFRESDGPIGAPEYAPDLALSPALARSLGAAWLSLARPFLKEGDILYCPRPEISSLMEETINCLPRYPSLFPCLGQAQRLEEVFPSRLKPPGKKPALGP
jgi:hypothetical protein